MSIFKIYLEKDSRPIRKKPYIVRWVGEFDPTKGKAKCYCKSFDKRKDADNFIDQLKDDFNAGMPRDQHDISLNDLCDKFIETRKHKLARFTLDGYKNTIKQLLLHFCPTVAISKIKQEDAEKFIGSLDFAKTELQGKGKQITDFTRNRHLRNCKQIFKTAFDWGYIRKNIFTPITATKTRKRVWHYISPEEFNLLFEKTPDIRNKAFYAMLYYCGLRLSEGLNLLWDGTNIDFEHNRVVIVNRPATHDLPSFFVKDYEERSVLMPKIVIDLLIKLHESAEEGNPFVFLTTKRYVKILSYWRESCSRGEQKDWISRNVQNNTLRDFKNRCRAAGIKTNEKLNLHCLRKSYATNLANAATPAHTLMKLMGHSSIVTTQKYYLHSSDANEQKAVQELEKISAGQSSQS